MHNLPCWPLAAGCEWSLIDAQHRGGEEAEQGQLHSMAVATDF